MMRRNLSLLVIIFEYWLFSDAFLPTVTRPRKVQSASLYEKISGEEVNKRLEQQLAKLREKDKTSQRIPKEELKVVFEDEHIIVVDKPSGVLTVSTTPGIPCLAQTVHEHIDSLLSIDQIVVHRLGMDTSGLVVFAKSIEAVRGMNALFRTRKITRQYEALVCGHVAKDQGLINLPLMRDYEHPPFMRVSTDEHQAALVEFDPLVVGKKILEAPKASLTHFQVKSREELKGLPVSRLLLTSISGRTHQLNVHCAAIGHPIVQDSVYGYNGEAAPHGGLELGGDQATTLELQAQIAEASKGMNMCVHSSYLKFRHPVTKEDVEFNSPAPF